MMLKMYLAAILNVLSALKSQHLLTTLIGTYMYVPSFTPILLRFLRRRFKRLTNQKFQSPVAAMFMTNQHQGNNTCAGTHREHHCQFGFLFCISQEEA
jgi:hypothetical protein